MITTTRHSVVTDRTSERNIAATVKPELHDKFEALAKRHNSTKGALVRRMIAYVVEHPEWLERMP